MPIYTVFLPSESSVRAEEKRESFKKIKQLLFNNAKHK